MKHKPVEAGGDPGEVRWDLDDRPDGVRTLVCLACSYEPDLTRRPGYVLWVDCTWHAQHGLVKSWWSRPVGNSRGNPPLP